MADRKTAPLWPSDFYRKGAKTEPFWGPPRLVQHRTGCPKTTPLFSKSMCPWSKAAGTFFCSHSPLDHCSSFFGFHSLEALLVHLDDHILLGDGLLRMASATVPLGSGSNFGARIFGACSCWCAAFSKWARKFKVHPMIADCGKKEEAQEIHGQAQVTFARHCAL